MTVPSFAFETCSEENNYLEELLPQPQDPAGYTTFPQKCVEAAHLSLPAQGFYGFCPTPSGKPTRTHKRACISPKYVSAVHSALVDVTDCLDYDTRLAFATFNLESAVHLNAVGAASDAGVGQLTRAAIDEVNLNAFDRAYRAAKSSNKMSCKRILPFMTKHDSHISERCGFMSLPENPHRNLIYSILLLQQNRRVINNLWNRYGIDLPEAVDSTRIKDLLTMLAYNSGPAGITSTLKAYSEQMGNGLNEAHFDFESTEPMSFVRFVLDFFPSTDVATRKRVSKYIGHVIAAARRADRLAGGTYACLHLQYLAHPVPPIRPIPPITRGKVFNEAVAKRSISSHMMKIASTYTNCHDFEFAFLGRWQTAEQLPVEIREVHSRLCRN